MNVHFLSEITYLVDSIDTSDDYRQLSITDFLLREELISG
jgi:hypothetical protein